MNFSRGKNLKIIFYSGVIIAAIFLLQNIAHTETQTGNINVNMNVPSETTGGGGTTIPSPFIYDVSSSTGMTTARVVWKINDYGYGLNTTSIFYSTDYSYINTVSVFSSGTEFVADISGLQSDTVYNFRITARNNSLVDATPYQPAQFKTQKAHILNSLTVLAKPEKRVVKTGGNYGAVANLLFFDFASGTILLNTTTALSQTGTTTLYNVEVPEATNLAVVLKTTSHLAKRLNGVNTAVTDLTLDFTDNNTFYLLAGDMAGDLEILPPPDPFAQFLQSARRDEFVDILDISAIVSKFNNQIPGEPANLNMDSIVDAQDISIVLGNWNKEGDIIVK